MNLRYNLNLTQYGDPVTEGLVRWNNAGTAAHFTWTPYNESVMDVYDDTGLGQGTLGRTTIVSTAGTDQTCTQGAITYVRIGLNPTTLGSGPTNDYWEIVSVSMHEFGHGMGLAHSNTGNVCGINGMYPYQSDSQSLMASGYNLSTRLPAPEVKQHDRQDMYDIYP